MRFAIIDGGIVANIAEASLVFGQSQNWVNAQADTAIGDLWDGTNFSKPATPPLDRQKLGAEVDDAVSAVTSPYTRFTEEYTLRESQAQAFKNGGYAGAVPDQVAAFATPAGMAPQPATDLILAQAVGLRSALDTLGRLRMQKYAIYNATSDAAAQATYDAILASIKAVADALS